MHIKILVTSDIHGHVFPTLYCTKHDQKSLGLAKAASLIKRIHKQATKDTIVITIENGDLLQGSPLTSYLEKCEKSVAPLIEAVNLLHYDAGVLGGNHEFDYGRFSLEKALQVRKYPLLCANILDEEGQPYFGRAYTIVEKKGVKIAILGLTTQFVPHWEPAQNITGLHFESAVATAKKYVPFLQKQADLVLVSYHGGYGELVTEVAGGEPIDGADEAFALSKIPGVAALITGHQHRRIATHVNGVPTIQPGQNGEYVGMIELEVACKSKTIQQSHATLLPVAHEQPDKEISALLECFEQRTQKWLVQPLARLGAGFQLKNPAQARLEGGHPFVDLLNQVQLEATGAEISAVALYSDAVTGFSEQVTIRDVKRNYPFENKLAVLQITGAQLRAALEQNAAYWDIQAGKIGVRQGAYGPLIPHYNYDLYAGIDYVIDVAQPVGERLIKLKYQGKPVQATQQFRLVVSQYRALGGAFRMYTPKQIVFVCTRSMPEMITDYLQKNEGLLTPRKIKHNIYQVIMTGR
nr:bifunctional UDP-sugar hydrolase/5'-nucleotidase [Liquorilactobacillus satsumensis]